MIYLTHEHIQRSGINAILTIQSLIDDKTFTSFSMLGNGNNPIIMLFEMSPYFTILRQRSIHFFFIPS